MKYQDHEDILLHDGNFPWSVLVTAYVLHTVLQHKQQKFSLIQEIYYACSLIVISQK